MIHELLRPDHIHLDVKGPFDQILRRMAAGLPHGEQLLQGLQPIMEEPDTLLLMPSDDVVLPHFRLAGLGAPQLALGISRRGIACRGKSPRIVLFLVSPEEDTAGHLKLLQRLSALLPELAKRLAAARSADQAIGILTAGEQHSVRPSFLNLTQDQVAFELRTDLSTGLSGPEAAHRLDLHGPNLIRKKRRMPWHLKLLRNFFSFFAVLLWLAALLCYLPGVDMPQLGAAILIVIFLNGWFSFLQEYRSDKAVEALQQLIGQRSRVVRDGRVTEIDAAHIVPGDLLLLEAGDIVPADARLIEANEVEVDNSSLTGESTSAKRYKSDRPALLPGRFLWIELPNVLFAGSNLITGTGRAVAFGTGMNSEIGRIARLTEAVAPEESPLQKQLRGTVYAIALLAAVLGLAFLLLGWLVAGLGFLQAMVFFIGIFVANVPEGLLPTVTLSLAMGVSRMAKRNAVVKHLSSVETLGCTTVICSDKTGTLTQNLVMVSRFWADGLLYEVTGEGYRPEGEFRLRGEKIDRGKMTENPAAARLLECAYICNNAHLEKNLGQWRILGDPTEGALVVLARKAGLRGTHQRLHVNPFESIRKRMSVLVKLPAGREKILYLKGALVETLELCDRILHDGRPRAISEEQRREILAASDAFARQGYRIMAFAYRDEVSLADLQDFGIESAEQKLIFIGFTAMSDPVRPGVPEAVRTCHTAGIRVIMITGDYPLTAESVGREVGLGEGSDAPPKVFTGAAIADMADSDLKDILARGETIFARVSPEQKLRIVSQLKALGEVVAVTGDGVNDGPALRRADIGIAMGRRGAGVAKEAAHMVLTDDNFASIVAAVEEGRGVFENIKRFVAYILNSNPQELYPYIFWMLFPGTPLAMTVMGVLAVDIGTDLIPAMGLGIERPESGLMDRPPRRKEEKLLSMGFILRAYFVQGTLLALACYTTYYFAGWYMGWWSPGSPLSAMPASPEGLDMAEASGAYLMSLAAYFFPTVTTQIANVLCKRSWATSLFSRDFLPLHHREEILAHIRTWRPLAFPAPQRLDRSISDQASPGATRRPMALLWHWLVFPPRLALHHLSRFFQLLEGPLIRPVMESAGRFLERHPILLNFISNPLIDLGIVFEVALCWAFFYTGLSHIYYFAPLPWPVYLFAFHGTIIFFAFEETKKYFRRRGLRLDFLG
ncbi:HAD-IC family P-type ATPase [Desulfococcus sp.]|uniref:HAD-IC family P-type ATPase n=1 Tax=Desulfococcus sp. TaxID=2025834 RepID=UPI0035949311